MAVQLTRMIFLVAILFALNGSVAVVYGQSFVSGVPNTASSKEVEDPEFETHVGTAIESETKRGVSVDREVSCLTALRVKKTEDTFYVVIISVSYLADSNMRFYQSVSFSDGVKNEVKHSRLSGRSDCSSSGCLLKEELTFVLDGDRLKKGEDLKFQLSSRSGMENEITLPAAYIEEFLHEISSEFR